MQGLQLPLELQRVRTTDSSTAADTNRIPTGYQQDTNTFAWHVGIQLPSDAATWLQKYKISQQGVC